MKFGRSISSYRKKMNLSQKELANKLNVSDKVISRWENDITLPDIELIVKMTKLFDVTLDEFILNVKNSGYTVENYDSQFKIKSTINIFIQLFSFIFSLLVLWCDYAYDGELLTIIFSSIFFGISTIFFFLALIRQIIINIKYTSYHIKKIKFNIIYLSLVLFHITIFIIYLICFL